MTTTQNNGRITIAVLGTKLDALTALAQEIKACQQVQAKEIGTLRIEDTELHGRVDRVNDRVTAWTVGQGALTFLGSSIAAFLGTRR